MDGQQFLQLFRNKLDVDSEDEDTADLVKALDSIPLAITQALCMSVRSYLEDFCESEKRKTSLLFNDTGNSWRYKGVSDSVAVTWQVTFQKIQSERPSAANVLSLMSYFHLQNIPEYLLCGYSGNTDHYHDSGEADTEFEDDIDVLRGYSLVMLGSEEGYCDMHPLVQCCTQVWASRFSDLSKWKAQFLLLMLRNFPDTGYGDWPNYDTWPTCQVLLPHASTVFEEEPSVEGDLACWIKLLENVNLYMKVLFDWPQLEKLAGKVMAARIKLLGESHKQIPWDMIQKGRAVLNQGRKKDARDIFLNVFNNYREKLGRESLVVLEAMSRLAMVSRMTSNFELAEKSLLWVIGVRRKVQGEDHSDTLESLADLAVVYNFLGRHNEEQALYEYVFATRKRLYGMEHKGTIRSIACLAGMCLTHGRLLEAYELQRWLIVSLRKVQGEENPETLLAEINMSTILTKLGRLDHAMELGGRSLETLKRVLGKDHEHVLFSMKDLARTWHHMGRWDDAISLLEDCVCRARRDRSEHEPIIEEATRTLAFYKEARTKQGSTRCQGGN